MPYHLRIYDNYHYMDESEAYNKGHYDTYKEAEQAARRVVEESLRGMMEPGAGEQKLLSKYKMFGDDPVIVDKESGQVGDFSAWTYANEAAKRILKKKVKWVF